MLAGVGEGLYSGMDEVIGKYIKYDRVFHPKKENHDRYEEYFGLYEKIYTALLPVFDEHAELKTRLS